MKLKCHVFKWKKGIVLLLSLFYKRIQGGTLLDEGFIYVDTRKKLCLNYDFILVSFNKSI